MPDLPHQENCLNYMPEMRIGTADHSLVLSLHALIHATLT